MDARHRLHADGRGAAPAGRLRPRHLRRLRARPLRRGACGARALANLLHPSPPPRAGRRCGPIARLLPVGPLRLAGPGVRVLAPAAAALGRRRARARRGFLQDGAVARLVGGLSARAELASTPPRAEPRHRGVRRSRARARTERTAARTHRFAQLLATAAGGARGGASGRVSGRVCRRCVAAARSRCDIIIYSLGVSASQKGFVF
mmetsp:Transcript_7550/g.23677  ORF Transcript_7550/g.23677 Transcript_7550/m.23677 type:complete len:205 (-) Transcript_7550:62-676(-)